MQQQRVLIVDDDEDIRDVLRLLLETEDFDVVGEAGDGLEAITLARPLQPEIAVIDHAMPRMAGDKTAEQLRVLVPGIKIVAFSAYLSEKPLWADAFLNKERIMDAAPFISGFFDAAQVQQGATG